MTLPLGPSLDHAPELTAAHGHADSLASLSDPVCLLKMIDTVGFNPSFQALTAFSGREL